MAANPTPIAIPGQDLGSLSTYIPGPGTHTVNNRLYASIPGAISISQAAKAPGPQKRLTKITPLTAEQKATVSIIRTAHTAGDADEAADKGAKQQVLPEVGSTVLCKVTRITPRQATVAILVVGETVLDGEWTGLIRVQDVRATEKDRVKIFESFRPGDIVRATVVCLNFLERPVTLILISQKISLGDQANYYLSTANNALGVIMATSEAGNAMYPVSWKEYKDPETGLTESRKVAKPF
jgi:exosome complex component CSL4